MVPEETLEIVDTHNDGEKQFETKHQDLLLSVQVWMRIRVLRTVEVALHLLLLHVHPKTCPVRVHILDTVRESSIAVLYLNRFLTPSML